MSILQKLSSNKIGVAFVIAHWFIIPLTVGLFLPVYFGNPESDGMFGLILLLVVVAFDLPAILFASLICLPIYIFSEDTTDFWKGVLFVSLFTVTFQWLFVGKIIKNFFYPKAINSFPLALND